MIKFTSDLIVHALTNLRAMASTHAAPQSPKDWEWNPVMSVLTTVRQP